MKVRVTIDRLVLDGVPLKAADRARLVARIETELARELRGDPTALPVSGYSIDRFSAPALALPHGHDVVQLGSGIAAAVRAGIGGAGR